MTQQKFELQTKEERELMEQAAQLAERIRAGQQKLWERWDFIVKTADGGAKLAYLKGYDEATVKLQGLNESLVSLGGRECLYQGTAPPASFCYVCPVENFRKEECPNEWGKVIV